MILQGFLVLGLSFWSHVLCAQEAAIGGSSSELERWLTGVSLDSWTTNSLTECTAIILKAPNWGANSESLNRWLNQAYSAQAVQKIAWNQISGLQRWCALFADHTEKVSSLNTATVAWLLNDPFLTEDFFANLSPKDHVPEVLTLLQEFHQTEPARFPGYNHLAIAMALVWDEPPPPAPHHQVAPDKVPKNTSSITDKFRFWIEMNEKKVAIYDLTKLDVDQLKFLVDATVPFEELQWVRNSAHYNRGNLDHAFSSVRYDEARLSRGQYTWPHENYNLKEIRKCGGICVDQAYFAAVVGKGNGIPTLFFVGEGRRGGHAWFGYMKSPDRWVMDCGRYQNDKYATGTATDPQTSQPISDHEIAFLAEPFRNTPVYRLSMAHLQQAKRFRAIGDEARSLTATETSIELAPFNLDAWDFKTALLEGKTGAEAIYQKHLNTMINQFVRYPDIKVACQQKLATLARAKGDEKVVALIEERMVRDNRDKRHDLSEEVFRNKLHECYDRGDWKGGQAVVHDAAMKLKDETGAVFELLRDFVTRCLQNGRYGEAKHALADFKNRVRMDSIIGGQFRGLQNQVKEATKGQR